MIVMGLTMRNLYFIALGSLCLIGVFFLPQVPSDDLTNRQNDLFNLLFRFGIVNFSLIMMVFPLLIKKGIVVTDYYNASHYEKAKSEFIIISAAFPGIICLSYLAFNISRVKKGLLIIVVLITTLRYLECIYTLFVKKNKH